jgi:hypothetical protein
MKPLALLLTLVASLQDIQRTVVTRSRVLQSATKQSWSKGFKQIPSTVIDKGVLRDIPYTSYRAGEVEVNVYGDPQAPVCVEIGIHGSLLKSDEAKKACQAFMLGLLDDAADRETLTSLKLQTGKKVRASLTFEITPPEAADAYGGWWISVYNETLLDRSRATPEEMKALTTSRSEVKKAAAETGLAPEGAAAGRWAADDLADARKTKEAEETQRVYKPTITKKEGKYVPDRTADDTGYILFICANSPKHEDREELIKTCAACSKESTFFWDGEKKCFICFGCGVAVENGRIKCSGCGTAPKRVRTKHK